MGEEACLQSTKQAALMARYSSKLGNAARGSSVGSGFGLAMAALDACDWLWDMSRISSGCAHEKTRRHYENDGEKMSDE